MGTFTRKIRFANPAQLEKPVEVEALVDTGALYSWVPAKILRAVGLSPQFRKPFILATGETVERDCAEAAVWLNGERRTTIVVFGDEQSVPLLGAYTLEAFALIPDPVNKRLVPLPALPAASLGGHTKSRSR